MILMEVGEREREDGFHSEAGPKRCSLISSWPFKCQYISPTNNRGTSGGADSQLLELRCFLGCAELCAGAGGLDFYIVCVIRAPSDGADSQLLELRCFLGCAELCAGAWGLDFYM
ncbi:unnamed protein product, partial [Iphiclides podalirius]